LNRAAKTSDDPLHDRESEAVARQLGSEERIEGPDLSVEGHSAARVRDLQLYALARATRRRIRTGRYPRRTDRDHPVALADRLRRIGDEVHHQLAKLRRVGLHGRQIAGEFGLHYSVLRHYHIEKLHHVVDQSRNVDRLGDRVLLPGIDHQLLNDSRAANRYVADSVQLLVRTRATG